jgi:uncharacterized membrane protein
LRNLALFRGKESSCPDPCFEYQASIAKLDMLFFLRLNDIAANFNPGLGYFMEETTDLFGIPVPSTDKVFLTFVVVHILISLVSVFSGLAAMLINKNNKRHPYFGRIYFWSMICAFVSVVILSVMRWPHNIHLLGIGALAVTFTFTGYRFVKNRKKNWAPFHTICMGLSYIFLLTGFYVDNGKNLPFWDQFPTWFFWIFPTLIGVPIIVWALNTNPLNKIKNK